MPLRQLTQWIGILLFLNKVFEEQKINPKMYPWLYILIFVVNIFIEKKADRATLKH